MQWRFRQANAGQMQQMYKNMAGRRGTMMSLAALAVGATAYGLIRRRMGGNWFQRIVQPIAKRITR